MSDSKGEKKKPRKKNQEVIRCKADLPPVRIRVHCYSPLFGTDKWKQAIWQRAPSLDCMFIQAKLSIYTAFNELLARMLKTSTPKLVSYRVKPKKILPAQCHVSTAPFSRIFSRTNNFAPSNHVCVLCAPVSVLVCLLAVVASQHHRHGYPQLK